MTCAEIDELAGAIALDAIPDEEWPSIREHLASCARGHPEVRDLRRVATLLLEAAPPVEPPAGLQARILAAARADLGVDAAGRRPSGESGSTAAVSSVALGERRGATPPAPEEPVLEQARGAVIRRTERAWWARGSWAAAAAAVLIAAGLAVWNVTLQRDLDRSEESLGAARTRAALQEQALAAVAGSGQQVRFATTVPGAGGTVLRPEGGTATLVVGGLPAAPDKIYQVWAIRGDQPVSLGIFTPDASGGFTVVALDHDLHNVDAVAISLEPGPLGSPLPTTTPLMVAALRA